MTGINGRQMQAIGKTECKTAVKTECKTAGRLNARMHVL